MRNTAQILFNIFFVISMLLSSTNVSASYWLECIGSITIKSKLSESIIHVINEEKYITADINIHDNTFTCRGHDRKINKKGINKNTKIFLPASLDENMLKKNINLRVKFDYSDGLGEFEHQDNSITKWTALKVIKIIPSHKISADTKALTEKQDLAKAKAIERIKRRIEQQRRQLEKGTSLEEPTADDKLNSADKVDTDRDGVSNRYDVCISLANPDQEDIDNDGVGDACDSCPNDPAPRYENGCPMGIEPFAVNKGIRSLGSQSNQTLLKHGLKRYNGQYYSVEYPADFLASPSGPIQSIDPNANLEDRGEEPDNEPVGEYYFINTDESFFESPDGLVEFFVYSPQWSGKSKTYRKVLKTENITAREEKKTIKEGVHYGHIATDWLTLKARDGSYHRSYVSKQACHTNKLESCVSHIFGIKYKNKKAYDRYRDAYIGFKKSLKKFAD